MASFSGCEPHADAFGGSVLLRKAHGSWEFVEYLQGLGTSACKTYHLKTGRDLLLCEGGGCFMGNCRQSVFVCDLSKEQNARVRSVIDVADDSGACPGNALFGSISNFALRISNGGGMPILTIWCNAGRSDPQKGSNSCDDNNSRKQARTYKLDFLFQPDSNTFVPAPWSQN